VWIAGCGSNTGAASGEPVADYSKVRMMASYYEGFLSQHRNQAPPSEQAFRDYINSKQADFQEGFTTEQMFVSPRSGKPLKWVYGRRPPVYRQNNMTCYAYEAEPVDGKRLVLGGRGMVAEIEESQFRSIFPQG
jgi:hypothetical protein